MIVENLGRTIWKGDIVNIICLNIGKTKTYIYPNDYEFKILKMQIEGLEWLS